MAQDNTYEPDTLTLDALRSQSEPDFVTRDPFALKAFYVAKFEELTGRTLFPAQTEMFMIEVMAYAHSIFGEAAQAAFLQNRAIWAEGRHLEEVGANVSTFRIPALYARAQVRFTLAPARAVSSVIPAGTRVVAGQAALFFATAFDLIIPAGAASGDVEVIAEVAGVGHNDLAPGQISAVVSGLDFPATVSNIQESNGGAEAELDDPFRLRIVNALERVSKAGPREGYVENVKAVSAAIVDVAVIRPQPGYITITPLMAADGQGAVSDDVVDGLVLAALDAETTVPMGDYVSILRATPVPFDVVMTLKIEPGTGDGLQAQAASAIRLRFGDWSLALGAQVAPSALVEAVRAIPGVIGVDGPGFDFTDLPATHFASLGEVTINIVETPNV